MRMTTKLTTRSIKTIVGVSIALASGILILAMSQTSAALSEDLLEKYSANNIMFYDPDTECSSGYISSICGSTAREKYWSALRLYFSETAAAGIMGNIDLEGGFSPVGVESCTYLYPYDFANKTWTNGWTWERFYNNDCSTLGSHDMCKSGGKPTGVGAFGITAGRAAYLQKINSVAPELIKYFEYPDKYAPIIKTANGCAHRHPEFKTPGDDVLNQIGDADFDALVDLEVQEMREVFTKKAGGENNIKKFNDEMSVREAAIYFARVYEVCQGCETSSVQNERANSAEAAYEELKDFNCPSGSAKRSTTPTSTNISPTTSSGTGKTHDGDAIITLVGDSISMMSEKQLQEKFPESFLDKVGSRHSTSSGTCTNDIGALKTLKTIAEGRGTISDQHSSGTCDTLDVDSNSLKNNVVWEIGTNTIGATEDTLNKVMDMIGKDRNLYLVTPYNGKDSSGGTDKIAEMYRKYAESHDNVYIVEWANTVKADTSKYLSSFDLVHPTADGQQLLADLIYEAVSATGGCTSYEGKYPEYLQWKGDWAEKDYGSDSVTKRTYHSAGCGPSSYAMIATVVTGQDIFPDDVGEITIPTGYYHQTSGSGMTKLDKLVGDKYGYEVIDVPFGKRDDAIAKIRKYLEDGYLLHMSGSGSAPFTPDGHYVGVFAIEGDTLKVADPNLGNADYDIKAFVDAGLHGGSFSASKSKGATNRGCEKNTCKDNGVGSVDWGNGFTKEQAQKLADFYNSDEIKLSDYQLTGLTEYGKKNCVTFSAFFVVYFTKIEPRGGIWTTNGNGETTVELLETLGFETGNDEIRPFTIFSVAGHTGVIVGIQKGEDGKEDQYITVEASYAKKDGFVSIHPRSYFKNSWKTFAYADSMDLDSAKLQKVAGR